MTATLNFEHKIEIVLIVGGKNKPYQEAAEIFNNRNPKKNIYHEAVRIVFN